MDQATRVQPDIPGNRSGNRGANNFRGNNNTIPSNTYMLPDGTNYRVGNQGGVPRAGGRATEACRLIPYSRNSSFTGRKNLVDSVRRLCRREGHNRVALCGLGGSGKTQIALEYVHQRASESDCDIFWVQGSGALKFSEGFRAIAQRVRIPSASTQKDEGVFLLCIRRWFEGPNSGNWVLVIDNADNDTNFDGNESPIAEFIPQGTRGTVIFTTRSRHVALRQGCEIIQVGKMGEGEALELFAKCFGSWGSLEDEEKKAAAMILDSVHHLPLAVVGSAAFMTQTGTPPSLYWAIFQENEERMKSLLSKPFSDIRREAASDSILSTYFATFDQIWQQMPLAADLLRLMAFFNHQNIPEELLTQCGLKGADHTVDFRWAIGKLLGFSLVTSVKCQGKTLYELDRLVQLSLQVYLPAAEQDQGRAAALDVILRCFPQHRGHIRPEYIPHALAVTKDSTDPIAEELGFRVALYFMNTNSCDDAETQFRRCTALREEAKGTTMTEVARDFCSWGGECISAKLR